MLRGAIEESLVGHMETPLECRGCSVIGHRLSACPSLVASAGRSAARMRTHIPSFRERLDGMSDAHESFQTRMPGEQWTLGDIIQMARASATSSLGFSLRVNQPLLSARVA